MQTETLSATTVYLLCRLADDIAVAYTRQCKIPTTQIKAASKKASKGIK